MKKLKILFDYSPAYKDNKTGIPIFVEALYSHLCDVESIEIEKTFNIGKYIPRKPHKVFRFFEQFLYHNLYLPLKLRWGKYDVYVESQYMFIPLFKPKNTLVVNMVYDIALILFDDLQTHKHTHNFRKKLAKSIENSDLIITLSEASHNDIENYLHETLQLTRPIDYIYADVPHPIVPDISTKDILDKFNISKNYFLFLGTLEPRKNPLTLLKAFHLFKQNTQSDVQLVFAGKKGWLYDDVLYYIQEHSLEDEVIFTGYITEEEKVILLKETKSFLFLSIYEGFGIPALEALKIGTPTLLSNIPVFHELFEDNALYTNHNDSADIAKSMEEILVNPPIIDKQLFEKFSWGLSASRFVEILIKHSKERKYKNSLLYFSK